MLKNFAFSNKLNVVITFVLAVQTLLAGRFWLLNVFSVIPPVFFTLLFFLLIVWNIIKKNPSGLLFTLVCIPFVIYLSDTSIRIFFNDQNKDVPVVKVFNWNTEFWEGENIQEFYDFLLAQKADVYHLQEHIKLENGEFVEMGDYFELQEVFAGYRVVQKTEFLTITKLPVVKSYENTDSYFLRVDVELGNAILSLYNVHMPVHVNAGLADDWIKFLKDTKNRFAFRDEQFNLLINDIQENQNLYYISGDFNTTKSMGKIQEVLRLGSDAAFAHNSLINGTWVINGLKLWRIDYNILHRGLKILSYTEVDPKTFSDHWAQIVKFQR